MAYIFTYDRPRAPGVVPRVVDVEDHAARGELPQRLVVLRVVLQPIAQHARLSRAARWFASEGEHRGRARTPTGPRAAD
eukprot:1192852-Prorocentrum_minimum.AAC.5